MAETKTVWFIAEHGSSDVVLEGYGKETGTPKWHDLADYELYDNDVKALHALQFDTEAEARKHADHLESHGFHVEVLTGKVKRMNMEPTTETEKPKTFAALVRLSTKSRVKDNTHKAQEAEIQRWADSNGFALRWYRELGVSGNDEFEPTFDEMVNDLTTDPQLAGVVAVDVDRFSLRENLLDALLIIKSLTDAKKAVVVLHQPLGSAGEAVGLKSTINFSDGIGQLVLFVSLWAASEERYNIKKRTEAGRITAKARGVKFGKPRKQVEDRELIEALNDICNGFPMTKIARLHIHWRTPKQHGTGVSTKTLQNLLDELVQRFPEHAPKWRAWRDSNRGAFVPKAAIEEPDAAEAEAGVT